MRRETNPSPTPDTDKTHLGRRRFLSTSALIAGTALAGGGLAGAAAGAPLEVPPTSTEPGRGIPETAYGSPSKYESHVARRRSDVLVNRQNLSDWSMTPIQHQHGIVTPNGLIFERHHNGVPDIDPKTYRLVVHGMVKQPLMFTVDDILRYRSVSKFYFLECSGNTLTDHSKAASKTVQQSHGLLSGAQWTGVPAAWLLNEAGLQPGAKWCSSRAPTGRTTRAPVRSTR